MPEFKKLKLAPKSSVPMEDGRDWPQGGETVEVTHYIRRRLADHDLVEVEEEAEPSDPPAKADPETSDESGKTRKGAK